MDLAEFQRARRILNTQSGSVVTIQLLGVIHSLLLLALLVVAGLVTSLLTTRGPLEVSKLPDRDQTMLAGRDAGPEERFGLYPIVADNHPIVTDNQPRPNPLQRAWGACVLRAVRWFPVLRSDRTALLALLVLALVLLVALCLIEAFRRSILVETVTAAATQVRRQIHRQMYRLGQSALPTEGIAPIISLFAREVNDVRNGLQTYLDQWPRVLVLGLGLLLLSALIYAPLALILLSLGGLVWFVARPLNRRTWLTAEAATRDSALQLALLQEDLNLLRMVRVFSMESVDNRRFDEHLERHRVAEVRRLRHEKRLNPMTLLVAGVAAVLAVGAAGWVVLLGKIAPAAAAVLMVALVALAKPASDWFALRRTLRLANRSAGALFDFLERKSELQQAGGAQFLAPLRERITFENVSLDSPTTGRTLLDGISLEIPARSRIAIMGRDEESKHALVCLIPRLIDPKVGRVRIDGRDIRSVTLESIRAQIATVLQSELVFSDSVTANIGLSDPRISLPRIIEAAKIAHAHHFIQDLPNGYDTIIGPLGHYLSLDEQYRIALARAFLHDPAIVIVEEPTAPLDEDTKHLIEDTIDRLAADKTLIFLPHRLSTIRRCDLVLILHNGRIEAMGSPRELQGESKLYRHLQYVEFNQFATGEIEAGQLSG